MAWIGRRPILRRIEAAIAGAPRHVALACFVIPGLALLPFKVVGLYFLAHGAPLLGLLTLLSAKVVGTALVARIFTLTKAQLLQIGWFRRSYEAFIRFKAYVFQQLHQHPAYQRIHRALGYLRGIARRWRRCIIHHLRSRGAVLHLPKRRGRLSGF